MTKRQFNAIAKAKNKIYDALVSLPKDDPAREYLYRAYMALNDMLAFTVPNPR